MMMVKNTQFSLLHSLQSNAASKARSVDLLMSLADRAEHMKQSQESMYIIAMTQKAAHLQKKQKLATN